MLNFLVVGDSRRIVAAVLQAIRSYTDAKCMVVGGSDTRPLRWSSLCDSQRVIDFQGGDDERFVSMVNELAARMPHMLMIPCDCDGIRLVNRVRDRITMGVTPIPELPMLERFDDKWLFHQFCTQHALPVPETHCIGSKSEADFNTLVSTLGLPFVLKPVNQAGSLGVQIVTSRAHFDREILNNAQYQYAPLIAQRYIDGEDIDLSVLSRHGAMSAFAIQQLNGAEVNFVSNHHLERIAAELCQKSRYHGVMHIDARIEKATGDIYLIECNPRFWASLTASVWCGLNFVAESIQPAARVHRVRQLTAGTAYLRHPIMRPSCWPQLLSDTGERGRLMRAITFDLPTLREFMRETPAMLWKQAKKLAGDSARTQQEIVDVTSRSKKST
ncbi:ATP-grasp domain-containing protein [Noviherbaspirillum cavernae]|uniref:ATP-grasp domain-containing protein n=1 Tax=Noviherbaspirillum cavernae TaxID=2320862 RepID=A0A418WVH4_9BURK|nr:ATP-grasp domain-containing protein [Noviherbaspirillum cavernae]RJF96724.1 ATP-grasp domain-containing protein [Noviherbaspirillum cavernae]